MATNVSTDVAEPQAYRGYPTTRQRKFVQALVRGCTTADAKRVAGYGSGPVAQILQSKTVQDLIRKSPLCTAEIADGVVASVMTSPGAAHGDRLRAAEIANKVNARYVERHEVKSLSLNAEIGRDIAERLEAMLEQRERERHGRK